MNRKNIGILLVAVGFLLLALILGLFVWEALTKVASFLSHPVIAGVAVATALLIAVGSFLAGRGRADDPSGEAAGSADFRHAWRLAGVLACALVLLVTARQLAVPATFGQSGFFRHAAIAEAKERSPRHLGKEACRKCHDKEASLHDKDAHAVVQCESCHGPGWLHAQDPKANALPRPGGKELCLACHRLLDARPGSFPQVDWREHFKFVNVKDEGVECKRCHNPHEPLFMDRDLRNARLHPLIHRCRDCHTGKWDESQARPPTHPPIFDCSYCHPKVAASFADGAHSNVSCTTCHIFIKGTDFSGRIIRDADPRFCLLCHGEADFRGTDGPPSIRWPEHRSEVSSAPEDAAKRCIDCHQDRIHLTGKGKEP